MLQVGQHIIDGQEEWVVTELLNQKNHTPRVRIRVEKVSERMGTYLTVGKEYVLRRGMQMPLEGDDHYVWVVPATQCKRTTSQVLLSEFSIGPGIDIDS